MPYKYIGRKTDFRGNTLWEIVGNLKNFGVGRIVIRSVFERYPEPSYLKILKVEPLPCPKAQNMDNLRKVRVLVEKTFRGETYAQPVSIESTSYKADYKLVPKDEEQNYCKNVEHRPVILLPKAMEFPPLLKEFILREKKYKGENTNEKLELPMVYKQSINTRSRVVEDGEEPTITFSVNRKKLPNISLYKNVK